MPCHAQDCFQTSPAPTLLRLPACFMPCRTADCAASCFSLVVPPLPRKLEYTCTSSTHAQKQSQCVGSSGLTSTALAVNAKICAAVVALPLITCMDKTFIRELQLLVPHVLPCMHQQQDQMRQAWRAALRSAAFEDEHALF